MKSHLRGLAGLDRDSSYLHLLSELRTFEMSSIASVG
jgi:hypothetical protein